MGSQSDIFRTANLMIEVDGEMAAIGAFLRADQLNTHGDTRGHACWLEVARTIVNLLSKSRPLGTSIH